MTFEDPLAEKTYQDYLKTREQLGRTKPVNLMDVATLAVIRHHLHENPELSFEEYRTAEYILIDR